MNEDEKALELVSLVDGDEPRLEFELTPPSTPTNKNSDSTTQQQSSRLRKSKFLILLSIVSFIVGLSIVHVTMKKEKEDDKYVEVHHDYHHIPDELILACPSEVKVAENDKDNIMNIYDENNQQDQENRIEHGDEKDQMDPIDLEKLKSATYDGWGKTFLQLKEILYDWKREYFSSLQSGDKIFESGCGKGFNLLMTIEILKESKNITDLQAYGVEYLPSSTKYANHVLKNILPGVGNATLGSPICRGDATNLDFVPSNSFDFAYTGYIDPIQDPLNLQLELGREVKWDDLCVSKGTPTKKGHLDQELVEEWYSKWIKELIRITKPGKSIVIEQVSLPTCLESSDWGGVSRTWWKRAVKDYEWNVDIESIVIRSMYDDTKKGNRYHVYMKKTL